MNTLLALIAGLSLNVDDAHLSYSDFNEIFPLSAAEEADDSPQAFYNSSNEHIYTDSYNFASGNVSMGYSIGLGRLGNLMSGELLNLSMIQGSMVSDYARLHLEYSMNTSEFSGDFLEGLFTIKNVLGFSAEFPVYGFTPRVYANMRTRHLLSAGDEDIDIRIGLHAGYSFLKHFSVSAFYEHEWKIDGNPADIDRAGLGFVFSY